MQQVIFEITEKLHEILQNDNRLKNTLVYVPLVKDIVNEAYMVPNGTMVMSCFSVHNFDVDGDLEELAKSIARYFISTVLKKVRVQNVTLPKVSRNVVDPHSLLIIYWESPKII